MQNKNEFNAIDYYDPTTLEDNPGENSIDWFDETAFQQVEYANACFIQYYGAHASDTETLCEIQADTKTPIYNTETRSTPQLDIQKSNPISQNPFPITLHHSSTKSIVIDLSVPEHHSQNGFQAIQNDNSGLQYAQNPQIQSAEYFNGLGFCNPVNPYLANFMPMPIPQENPLERARFFQPNGLYNSMIYSGNPPVETSHSTNQIMKQFEPFAQNMNIAPKGFNIPANRLSTGSEAMMDYPILTVQQPNVKNTDIQTYFDKEAIDDFVTILKDCNKELNSYLYRVCNATQDIEAGKDAVAFIRRLKNAIKKSPIDGFANVMDAIDHAPNKYRIFSLLITDETESKIFIMDILKDKGNSTSHQKFQTRGCDLEMVNVVKPYFAEIFKVMNSLHNESIIKRILKKCGITIPFPCPDKPYRCAETRAPKICELLKLRDNAPANPPPLLKRTRDLSTENKQNAQRQNKKSCTSRFFQNQTAARQSPKNPGSQQTITRQ